MEIIKNNINKFIIAITLMITLIGIFFISTTTYAYTIDVDGNLVGENLIKDDFSNISIYTNNATLVSTDNNLIITNVANHSIYTGLYYDFNQILQQNVEYTFSCYVVSTNTIGAINIGLNGSSTFLRPNNTTYKIEYTFIYNGNNFITYFDTTGESTITLSYIMLNVGNTAKEWEPYGIWYSETNYNELMNRYNSLNTNINIFENNILSQKILINNIEQTYNDYDTLFKPLQRTLYINQDNEFRFVYQDFGENTYIRYEIILINEVSAPRVTGKIDLIDYANINMYDVNDNNIMELYYNSMSGTLGDGNFEYQVKKNIKKIIIEIELDDTNEGRTSSVINFGNSYADGYLTGVNESNTYWETRYNVINAKYNDLFNTNNFLNNQIEQLEQQKTQKYNEGYANGYNAGANGNNSLYNMVIAVADTPINIFKQIFNFNILGLDISGFIFGLISLLIIVWLIKKII